ncbi:hypothetical protein [Pseudactinotalea sp. Z1732]
MRPHLDPDDYTDDDGYIDLDAMRTDYLRDEGDRRRAERKEGADSW